MFEVIKKAYILVKTDAQIGITKKEYLGRSCWFWLLIDFILSPFFWIIYSVLIAFTIYYHIYV